MLLVEALIQQRCVDLDVVVVATLSCNDVIFFSYIIGLLLWLLKVRGLIDGQDHRTTTNIGTTDCIGCILLVGIMIL